MPSNLGQYTSREIARMRKNTETTDSRVAAAESFLGPRKEAEVVNSWFAKEIVPAVSVKNQEKEEEDKKKKEALTQVYTNEREAWLSEASPEVQLRARLHAKKKALDQEAAEKKRLLEIERLEAADALIVSNLENSPEVREARRRQELVQAAAYNYEENEKKKKAHKESKKSDQVEIPLLVAMKEMKYRYHLSLRPSEMCPRLSTPEERPRLEKAFSTLDPTAKIISVKLIAAPGGRFALEVSIDSYRKDLSIDAVLGIKIHTIRRIEPKINRQQLEEEAYQKQKLLAQQQQALDRALAEDRRLAQEAAQLAIEASAQRLQEEVWALESQKQKERTQAAIKTASARRQELATETERRRAQRVAQRALELESERERLEAAAAIETREYQLNQARAVAEAELRRLEYQHCLALAKQQQAQLTFDQNQKQQDWEFWQDHEHILKARRAASRRLQEEVIQSWAQQEEAHKEAAIINQIQDDTEKSHEIAIDEAAIRAELWAAKARENAEKLLAHEHFAAYAAREAQRADEKALAKAEDEARMHVYQQRQRQLKAHVAATLGSLPQHRLPPELRDKTDSLMTPREAAAKRRQKHFDMAAGRSSAYSHYSKNKSQISSAHAYPAAYATPAST